MNRSIWYSFSYPGAFLESVSLGGPGSNSARSIAFDSAGNRYIGGYFEGQAQFPQRSYTSAGGIDTYVIKLPATATLTSLSASVTTNGTSIAKEPVAKSEKTITGSDRLMAIDLAVAELDFEHSDLLFPLSIY